MHVRGNLDRFGAGLLFAGLLLATLPARAQVPTLGGLAKGVAPKATAKGESDKPQAVPTKESPHATVATSTGPISVREPVSDAALARTLRQILPRYPGVRAVDVDVDDGVVTLNGQVQDDVHDDVTDFVRRVQGVRLVLNRMRTDSEVLTGRQLAERVLNTYWLYLSRKWLLILLAVGLFAGSTLLARLMGRYSDTLLAPFLGNPLLRSVVGSLLSTALVVGGLMLGLSILDLTQVVLSILGLAGVVGLAVGFAFKDITENFIASVLLGVRRPFRIGDYVTVAGQSGVVQTLNTRATVLVTLEGKQVRIPNAVIFKEILVNSSASTSSRGTFDLLIPYEVSADAALEAIDGALRGQEGVLRDPEPRALVEALEPGGVRLRAFYWSPTQGIDGDKLASDAKLKVKVALQRAGIAPPPTNLVTLTVAGRVPVDLARGTPNGSAPEAVRPCSLVTPSQAQANLRRDAHAAANASLDDSLTTPLEHARNIAESHVSDEGTNLLQVNGKHEG